MKILIRICLTTLFFLCATNILASTPLYPPPLVTIANAMANTPISYRLGLMRPARITKGHPTGSIPNQFGFQQIYLAGINPILLLLFIKDNKNKLIAVFQFSLWRKQNTQYQEVVINPNYRAVVCGASPNNFEVNVVKQKIGMQLPPPPC